MHGPDAGRHAMNALAALSAVFLPGCTRHHGRRARLSPNRTCWLERIHAGQASRMPAVRRRIVITPPVSQPGLLGRRRRSSVGPRPVRSGRGVAPLLTDSRTANCWSRPETDLSSACLTVSFGSVRGLSTRGRKQLLRRLAANERAGSVPFRATRPDRSAGNLDEHLWARVAVPVPSSPKSRRA